MQLNDLRPAEGSRKNRKRIGRGNSSGHGTTAGRGTKGQLSRSGGGKGKGFEGGQQPLAMRLPKLPGFKNHNRVEYAPVNVARLDALFADGETVDADALVAKGVIKYNRQGGQGLRLCQGQDRGGRRKGRAGVLKGIANAFRVPELRQKLLLTAAILLLYRFGAYLPVPGAPFQDLLGAYQSGLSESGAMAVLNLFSGGALSRMSVFSLGIMPYITAQIILQLLQAVIPSLGELAREGEAGQRRITQYTRYLTIGLALLNAIGYLFMFRSYGVSLASAGVPELLLDVMIVFTMVVGAMLIMWLGEIITQRGVGNGMSLIIFANIMSGLPTSLISSVTGTGNIVLTVVTMLVIVAIIPLIVFVERGQRRIPIQYAKRVVGRRMMGGQSTYLPIKVNTAGVVPIIFASAILYLPAQLAVFFPSVEWVQGFANALSTGWINWVLSVVLIVAFAYFYSSMVFNPTETADQLRKQGGFIPGVRPGAATAAYIKSAIDHVTLPGALFMAVLAVVPTIIFWFTGNSLIQAMDTLSSIESQLKMHNYDGFFK